MAKRNGLSFYKRRKKINMGIVREVFSWIFGILTAVFVAGVLNYFWGMSINMAGVSMEPALYNGQKLYVDRFSYLFSMPQAGDVVVFLPNGNENSHYYVKRVAAAAGDSVRIADGLLYVNGLVSEEITVNIADAGIAENEIVLENGEFFCIGDSPASSEDSRSANIGPVSEEDIVGKVWFAAACEEKGMGFVK